MRRDSALFPLPVFLLALLLGLGSVGASLAQEATPAITPAPLAWTSCGERVMGWECAVLPVPLDYANPNGTTTDMAVTRLVASDPERRIGALFFNPGGPGGSGVGFLNAYGDRFFPDEIRARFDIVSFDPRGIGASGQIDCHPTEAYYAIDPSPDDAAEREVWLAGARDYAAACAADAGEILPFLGTENVVSDMEQLRLALGEETISFLGLSYGTSLGARYADRYPERVRAFALDSALPSYVNAETFVAEWVDGIERAFDSFLADCAAALTCAFHSHGDPAAAFDALQARLEATPLEVTSDGPTRLVGQREVLGAVDAVLSEPAAWPLLATALQAAVNGDGAQVLRLADLRNERLPDGTYGPGSSGFLAVSCLDFPIARDPAAYEALAAKAAVIAPRLGAYYATWTLPCVYWAAPPTTASHVPVATGAPPILVIGATLDTQDPYGWSVDMAGQLASGVLLRREGTGHPSYFESACVEDAITAYLLDLTLPDPNLFCDSTDPPRERLG